MKFYENTEEKISIFVEKYLSEEKLVFLLFIVASVLKTVLFLKGIANRAFFIDSLEELINYNVSSSLIYGNGISVYNVPVSVRGILYPLIILPVFLLPASLNRIYFVFTINAVLMSTGIFPVHYLASKLIQKKENRLLICLTYLLFSFQFYSMTLLSVNLFIPLALILTCLFYNILTQQEALSQQKLGLLNVTAGLMTYLLYLTDESAVLFLGAFLICQVICFKKYTSVLNQISLHKKWLKVQVLKFLFGFLVPFICISELIYFLKIYDMTPFYFLDASKGINIAHIFYVQIYILIASIITMYVVPILLPIVYFDKLSTNAKQFFILLICLLIASTLGGALQSVGELSSDKLPIINLRYTYWVYIAFVIVLFHLLENCIYSRKIDCRGRLHYIMLPLILLPLFPGLARNNLTDHSAAIFDNLSGEPLFLYLLGIAIICTLVAWYFSNHKKTAIAIFTIALFAFQLQDILTMKGNYWNTYTINQIFTNQSDDAQLDTSQSIIKEAIRLSRFAEKHSNKSFLIVTDSDSASYVKTLATYFFSPNVRITSKDKLKEKFDEDGTIIFANTEIPISDVENYETVPIDYVISTGNFELSRTQNCQKNMMFSSKYYSLFQINDSSKPVYLNWTEIQDFDSYFSRYDQFKENYVLIVSVRDEASNALKDEQILKMNQCGLEKTEELNRLRSSYICIIEGGKCLYSAASLTEILNYSGILTNGKSIKVISGGYDAGNLSSIKINDIEYSINKRGLNIVLYDLISEEVVDSVCIDTYVSANAFDRVKN